MIGVLIIAALPLSACAQVSADAAGRSQPALVELIEGTDLNRLTLTERASERLAIETALVREEQLTRTQMVGGQVEAPPEGSPPGLSDVWVRVPLSGSVQNEVDRSQPALIVSLAEDDNTSGLTAQPVEAMVSGDFEEEVGVLYYVIDNADHGLAPGQRVLVELTLLGSGAQQTVIPYSAVIYDLQGQTWIYTSPEPLTFVRQSITVDYIEGDIAVLSEGPPAGTAVVTVGVAELYGLDTGVGK
jgi:hypothetical protein